MLTGFDNICYNKIMNTINLNEKEKRILRALYEINNASINNLAKETLINRTTLYPILDKLLAKGLVSKLSVEGKIIFQPILLKDFEQWITGKEQEFKKESEGLLNWTKTIKSTKTNSLFFDIKYFEGFDGVKNLYADTWRDNKEKMIYGISDYKSAYKAMEDFFKKEYFPSRVKHKVKIKNILSESEEGRKEVKIAKSLLREMKFVKFFKDLNIDVNIYSDKIAIIAFDEKHPSGVLIKNEKIALAFRNIFEYIWKITK